jgi:hypothetical protein
VETSAGRKKGANEENAENEEGWSKQNKTPNAKCFRLRIRVSVRSSGGGTVSKYG